MPGIHFQLTPEDKPYQANLKNIIAGRCRASVSYEIAQTSMDAVVRCKKYEHTTPYVVSTDEKLLQLITGKSNAKLDDFSGSIINHIGHEHLFIHPLDHLVKVPYGKFLLKRYLSKLTSPDSWLSIPAFNWELFQPSSGNRLLQLLQSATFIACDIENDYPSENRCITCISFSAVRIDPGSRTFTISTFVVPFTEEYNISFIRTCMSTSAPKIFQNGKFDISYLIRFAIPVYNYGGDTINLFHSWYSELPKDLASIGAFCLRNWTYWKDEAANQIGSMEYYQYNAKDTFATALSWLVLLTEAPEFAIKNFEMEFPVVFPCILSELTGIKIDEVQKANLSKKINLKADDNLTTLRIMVADPKYNPGSWQQTEKLWEALGSQDIKGTGKVQQDKVGSRHPINRVITDKIKRTRELRKLESSYVGKEISWHNRCLYALNPHGTDTGRLSSRESQFNCGIQIQNIKRDEEEFQIKSMFVADSEFYIGEADYAQNETWGTAYTTGDENLIAAIEDKTKDFHGLNASEFFGIAYEKIVKSYQNEFGIWLHKKLDKIIRDLSKRTNHGANYNMAAQVLLDTMGIANVIRAKKLLGLPPNWSLIQVTQFLLDKFDERFPVVRGKAYDAIKSEVKTTSQMVGPTGWTRYCFSDPNENKRSMNMYAAHKPQSLAAMVLNKAYVRVINEVWMENQNDFKLLAQVHDSILFMYRIGRSDLPHKVAACMDIHTNVIDIFGHSHDLNVPVDLKGGGTRWSELEELR